MPWPFVASNAVAFDPQDAAAEWGYVGALERMQDELGRARRRGGRIVVGELVQSPMDCNPTLELTAAMIAECDRRAGEIRVAAGLDPSGGVVDAGMLRAARGTPGGPMERETA